MARRMRWLWRPRPVPVPPSTLQDGVRASPGCRRQCTWTGPASEGSEGNQLCGSKGSARPVFTDRAREQPPLSPLCGRSPRPRPPQQVSWQPLSESGRASGGGPGPAQLAALSAGGATCCCLPKGLKVGAAGNQAAGPSAPQRPPAQGTAVWRDSRFRRSPGAASRTQSVSCEDTRL